VSVTFKIDDFHLIWKGSCYFLHRVPKLATPLASNPPNSLCIVHGFQWSVEHCSALTFLTVTPIVMSVPYRSCSVWRHYTSEFVYIRATFNTATFNTLLLTGRSSSGIPTEDKGLASRTKMDTLSWNFKD